MPLPPKLPHKKRQSLPGEKVAAGRMRGRENRGL